MSKIALLAKMLESTRNLDEDQKQALRVPRIELELTIACRQEVARLQRELNQVYAVMDRNKIAR